MARDRREYYKEWRKNNPDKVKEYTNKRIDWAGYMGQLRTNNPAKSMWGRAKRRAKEKGFRFNIEVKDIDIPVLCPILHIPIFYKYTRGKIPGPTMHSPSLDRIDNNKGYVKGNIRVISHKANTMKHNATSEELIKFARWVLNTYTGEK